MMEFPAIGRAVPAQSLVVLYTHPSCARILDTTINRAYTE